jgi:hypothetical protein
VRNVICVADGGRVVHFSQKESGSWTRAERRRVPEALRIAAYDLGHHGLVLSRTAEITDQPFHGVAPEVMQRHADTHKDAGHALEDEVVAIGEGEEQPVFVGTYEGALDIAGFFVGEEERYVIEADRTGAITEIGYGALQPASRRVLATLPNVRRISACYAGDGQMGRKLLASTDQGAVWLYEYGTDVPSSGRNLDLQASTDVHCFSTPDNEVRVLLASAAEVLTAW